MRIFYDHQVFSLQDRGGISRYYFELIRHLSEIDSCSIQIFAGVTRNSFQFSDLPQVRRWEFRGQFTPPPGRERFVINEALSNLILPFCGSFDVYHPTLYRYAPLVRHQRMVVTHHDCAYERYPELFRNAISIRQMRTRLFARADAIICPSEATRSDLHEFYDVPEEKSFVVYHGIASLPPPSFSTQRLSDCPFLLYVGSRAAYKNFDGFLRAFAASPLKREFGILVLGGTVPTASERALIADLSLQSVVRFVSVVSDEFLARAYREAHLFVYPSLYEGFGFPPLEAMLAGCPILLAASSALPEICKDAAFYFDPDNHADFVDRLESSCLDETRRLQKTARARVVAGAYNWEKCATDTLRIYTHCVEI